MKKFLLPLIIIPFICACSDSKEAPKAGAMPSLVNTAKLLPASNEAYYEYPATTKSDKDVMILSKASGEVIKIYAKDGSLVKKGELIALIDNEMPKAQLSAARADLAAANAELSKASTELKRAQALKASTSKKELDTKEAAFLRAKAAVSKAQAAVKIAQINEKHTKIIAPFDGKLAQILVSEGDYVNASSSKIVRISDASNLKAQFFIPDSDRAKLKDLRPGTKASFDYLGTHYEGELGFIDSNNEQASISAYAKFSASDVALNSFVKLRLENIKLLNTYKISKENLLQDINGYYVYIKRANKALAMHARLLFEDDKYALISASELKLEPKDELILNNYKKIHPGSLVATDAEFAAMMKASAASKLAPKEQPKQDDKKHSSNDQRHLSIYGDLQNQRHLSVYGDLQDKRHLSDCGDFLNIAIKKA